MCFDKSLFFYVFWLINSSQKIYILNCCGICYYKIFVKHREKRELNTRQKSEKKLQINVFTSDWFQSTLLKVISRIFSSHCGISFFFCFLWMDASKSYTGRECEFQIFAFYCFCSSNKTKKNPFQKLCHLFVLNVLKIWSDTHRCIIFFRNKCWDLGRLF